MHSITCATPIAAAVEIGNRDVIIRDFIITRLHAERNVHSTCKRVITSQHSSHMTPTVQSGRSILVT